MHVTIFRGAKDTAPIAAEDLPWPDLVTELDDALAETAPTKTALLAIGPYRLRDGSERGDANVVERTLIALDSDDGTPPESYVDRLRDLGLAAYVYTTPSDAPEKRKCRVVTPITSPLAPDAARAAMVAFAEVLGMQPGCGVERTLDHSRLYFVGRLAGTPPRQRWIVEGEPLDVTILPPSTLPWTSAQKLASNVRALRKVDGSSLERAIALAERMPPSIEGMGGDDALFRAACEIATVTGPEFTAIRTALDSFNARCLPPWPGSKLDREASRAAERANTLAARTLRRVTSRTQQAPQTEAAQAADEGAAILTTPKGRDVFVFDPRIDAYREVSRENLVVMLRTCGADAFVDVVGPRGGMLSPQAIIERSATMVEDAIADFRSPAQCLYDRESKRLLLGIACPTVEAREDERVGLWLEAIAGDEIGAVLQWIASTRQDAIHRLSTALCLIGPHGAGKTVFAEICGRLWGAPPVELDNVAAQFNAAMATCPIVLDDECKCLAKKNITTEQFRVLVQARFRRYEPKGKERRPLLGAQRFIITANDVTDLRFANAVGHGAVDALAERITIVSLDDEQGAHARAALDAVRVSSGDLDWPALVGHFEHIRQTITLPTERSRFLGQSADRAKARRAVIAHALDADAPVYERIGAVATGAASGDGPVFVASGALWVSIKSLAEILHLSTGADRWDVARVRRAVEPIRGPRDLVWRGGSPVRAREIDVSRLVEFCGLDGEAVRRTLAAGA